MGYPSWCDRDRGIDDYKDVPKVFKDIGAAFEAQAAEIKSLKVRVALLELGLWQGE